MTKHLTFPQNTSKNSFTETRGEESALWEISHEEEVKQISAINTHTEGGEDGECPTGRGTNKRFTKYLSASAVQLEYTKSEQVTKK